MDTTGGFDTVQTDVEDATDAAVEEQGFVVGSDERRMHVRAYNHWVSLLNGAPFPAIDRLDPAAIGDFGPHSVLLDFSNGLEDPVIAYLGTTLRTECGLDSSIARVADVPSRSLLSRLTDHYLQIIANRAPIGFEAEFVATGDCATLYRGILMPYSSNGTDIDFIYGVINWKVMADAAMQATLTAELDAAVRAAPSPSAATPVFADGPSAGLGYDSRADDGPQQEERSTDTPRITLAGTLGDCLAMARESAAQVRASDARGRAALYRALGRAYDFAAAADADPERYQELLADAVITVQTRAPMTPVVKLVFGADYDKTRLAEYAAVLSHARRHAVVTGSLGPFLDGYAGGIKAIVAAERAARRPAKRGGDAYDRTATALRKLPVLANVPIGAGNDEFVVLVARAGQNGTVDIIRRIDAPTLVEAAMKRAAA